MKNLILAVFVVIALFTLPTKVYGLDYEIQGLLECENQQVKTKECEKILCEKDNIERNWPEDTGYLENCNREREIDSVTVLLAAGGSALLLVAGVIIVRRKRKK